MAPLTWKKCTGGVWCSLLNLDLSTVTEHGVYVIWHGGASPRVVYVGQGDVADRVGKHRRDSTITQHARNGPLVVTWASVLASQRDGVERHLADRYSPLEGEQHPLSVPIAVNGPWD
jgi:hypothetical protein